MQVTLQIDASQLTEDIRELLSNMSDAKKEELAVTILTDALRSGETTLAKYVGVDKALEAVNQGKEKYRYNSKDKRLETEKGGYWVADRVQQQFDEMVKKYAHFYGYFQEIILDKMLAVAMERVEALVNESPAIQKTIDNAVREIEGQFAHIAQAALVRLLMSTLKDSIINNEARYDSQKEQDKMLQKIQERLDRGQIY